MMRLGLVLAVLFNLGLSAPVAPHVDHNLNKQLIDNMKKLNGNLSFPKNYTVQQPGNKMRQNAQTVCVVTFINGLRDIINNVTVTGDHTVALEQLRANLQALEDQQETTNQPRAECSMEERSSTSRALSQYINFLKRLNSSR